MTRPDIKTVLGSIADVIAVVLAIAAITEALLSAAPALMTAYLLAGIAAAGILSAIAPWDRAWIDQTARAVLACVVAVAGLALWLDNPAPPSVDFNTPGDGDLQQTCALTVRFTGKPARGQRFVLGTRQDRASYYFEGAVQQGPKPDQWTGTVQVGFKNWLTT
jgi:hypothetical protein